jgi:hypothetical protein
LSLTCRVPTFASVGLLLQEAYLPCQDRLIRARQLGGEIKYLSQGEIAARNRGYSPYSVETWRTWEYWANKAGCGHLLTRPDQLSGGGHAHPPKG